MSWTGSALELPAPAKLNLFLEVLRRRDDGYHELDSVFAQIDLADTVELHPANSISLSVDGPEADGVPTDAGNLAWRAAELLGVCAAIRIHKRIPPGGGLGGGSSDAAAVLVGLNKLLTLGRSAAQLHDLAAQLGADVPFFLTGGTARCRGIGDLVEPVQNPRARHYLLLLAGVHCSTSAVFSAFDPGLTGNPRTATVFLADYLDSAVGAYAPYFNRLQGAAEQVEPRLRMIREEAEGRFGVSFTLTGSGSSYFAEVEGGFPGNSPSTWTVENVPVRAMRVRAG